MQMNSPALCHTRTCSLPPPSIPTPHFPHLRDDSENRNNPLDLTLYRAAQFLIIMNRLEELESATRLLTLRNTLSIPASRTHSILFYGGEKPLLSTLREQRFENA